MLTVSEIKKMFGKEIKVILSDGLVFHGTLTGFYDKYDTMSGSDEIELDIGKSYVGLEVGDIISAEIVS